MRFLAVLLLIVLSGASAFFTSHTIASDVLQIGSYTTPKEHNNEKSQLQSIVFVGDIMLARRVESILATYGNEYVYRFLPKYASSTILIGNFEAAIPQEHKHTPDHTFRFSVDEKSVPALYNTGFRYMNIANNHTFDYQEQGLQHTQDVLAQNKIHWFGNPNKVGSTSLTYLNLNDKRVALLGTNTINVPFDKTKAKQILQTAISSSDLLVVSIHWGDEYKVKHSKQQEDIAHFLADNGADIIIGHHPHVIQDIEKYNHTLIFYSLGNFIFDQYFSDEVQQGLMVQLFENTQGLLLALQGVTSIDTPSSPQYISTASQRAFLQKLAKHSSLSLQSDIQNGLIPL